MESSQFIDIPEMDGLLNSYSSTTNQPFVYKIPVTYLENLSPNRPMIIDSCSNIVIQARNNKHVRVNNKMGIGLDPSSAYSLHVLGDVCISGNLSSNDIVPLFDRTSNLGSVTNKWKSIFVYDLSVVSINGAPISSFGGGSDGGTSNSNLLNLTSDIIPFYLNVGINPNLKLGSVTNYWGNAYIRDISATNISVSSNLNPLVPNSGTIGLVNRAWGNAYINDISISCIDISVNLNPLVPNKGTIGLVNRRWGNAYINDISVVSIDISVNLNPLVPNKGTIGLVNKPWGNAYINDVSVASIDVSVNLNPLVHNKGSIGLVNKSWGNAYINDISVASIDISVNLNPLFPNKGSIGLVNKSWGNAYINDISVSCIDISVNLNPLVPNKGTIGLANKLWGNAYINDISVASIDVSVNLNPLVPNKGSIGLSNRRWGNAYINDVSVSSIDVSVNLNPLVPNKGSIGLVNKPWGNAYINDISVASIDISVNLNPLVPNKGTIGVPNKAWGNAYINDISATNIEPLSNNTSNLGSLTKRWNNIYTTDLNATNISVNQLTVTTLSQDNITNVINSLLTRITTLEARSNVYKIEYLRWYNSFTMNGLGGFDGFAMNTAGGDAPATFVKIANTKIAIKTSFRYTCAGFNGDYLLSKLSIYQGTNFILEGSFVEQLWTGANGGGTRSGTLTDCSVFMDTPSHIAMSGTLIVKLEISKTGLDDPLQLGPGYFEVIHLYN